MTPSAEDWIDRAWDARTDKTRTKYAKAAIAADADAIDGYVLLGQSLTSEDERIAALREGVTRGRRRWAAEMKRPAQNAFWLDLDTRPFMRAVHLLALACWDRGERDAAIGLAKLLLRLNRNDNQGIRDLLAVWYPATGDWTAFGKLLARYRDDWTTGHLYAAWLLAFHDGAPTEAALSAALDVNGHVPAFLADADAVAEEDPDDPLAAMGYVTMGSPAEAAGYAEFARAAWQSVPGAIDRLCADAMGVVATA